MIYRDVIHLQGGTTEVLIKFGSRNGPCVHTSITVMAKMAVVEFAGNYYVTQCEMMMEWSWTVCYGSYTGELVVFCGKELVLV